MRDTLRKALGIMDRRARWRVGLLFFPMGATAALELLSTAMILPLIETTVSGTEDSQTITLLSKYLPSWETHELLIGVIFAFTAIYLFKNIALLAMYYLINRTIQSEIARFVQRLFTLYARQSLDFHLRRNSAELMRNLFGGASLAFESPRLLLVIVLETMLVTAVFGLLLVLEPIITLVACGVLAVTGAVFLFYAGPAFKHWGAVSFHLERNILQTISEMLGSIRDILLLNAEYFFYEKFKTTTDKYSYYYSLQLTSQLIPRLLLETIIIVIFAVVLGTMILANQETDQLMTTLGLFAMASLRLMPSFNKILAAVNDLTRRTASIDTIYAEMALFSGSSDQPPVPSEVKVRGNAPETVTFDDVSLCYPNSESAAVQQLNLHIERGTSIAIVGPSGAGKSSVLNMFLGFLSPTGGSIRADGRDIQNDLHQWREHLGFVPQTLYLLDDTLRRNIAFGVAENEISEERLQETLRLARLEDVVADLDKGLDTVVGEAGVRLSGGQRQRVAIARALYRNPDILVLDEATAALDNETEQEIADAINALSGTKTLLIVAHRLSTVQDCDTIVYMRDGALIDQGTFSDLYHRNSEFRRMADLGRPRQADQGEKQAEV